MRIAVLGAGAMGALFGGLLAEAGQDVVLLDVDRAQIRAIGEHGLLLATDSGIRRVVVRIERPDEARGEPDWLVVFTKAFDTTAALETCRASSAPPHGS